MFGHQPQQPPITDNISSITISFQFHLNRLPENLPHDSNVSTSNNYSGMFGRNILDRLLTYLYIFDVATETQVAIDRDRNGKDITSTFKAVISGFRGDAPFSVTFTDVPPLHQWLATNHIIPNINDSKVVIDKDGVKGAYVLESDADYQRYIATHHANPLLRSANQEVKALHSEKRELEVLVQRLTNEVNRMNKAREDELERKKRASAAQHKAAMRRIWE